MIDISINKILFYFIKLCVHLCLRNQKLIIPITVYKRKLIKSR